MYADILLLEYGTELDGAESNSNDDYVLCICDSYGSYDNIHLLYICACRCCTMGFDVADWYEYQSEIYHRNYIEGGAASLSEYPE